MGIGEPVLFHSHILVSGSFINYKKDKLINCKSRKYWDSYGKEKHNLTQCSFKFIIIHIFHTFFVILTLLFLSPLIELRIKSEITYCSQTQSYT